MLELQQAAERHHPKPASQTERTMITPDPKPAEPGKEPDDEPEDDEEHEHPEPAA